MFYRFLGVGGRGWGGYQVMLEEAVALKGQMCSVVFVSGTLVLLPFAVIMEGAQVGQASSAAAATAVGGGGGGGGRGVWCRFIAV